MKKLTAAERTALLAQSDSDRARFIGHRSIPTPAKELAPTVGDQTKMAVIDDLVDTGPEGESTIAPSARLGGIRAASVLGQSEGMFPRVSTYVRDTPMKTLSGPDRFPRMTGCFLRFFDTRLLRGVKLKDQSIGVGNVDIPPDRAFDYGGVDCFTLFEPRVPFQQGLKGIDCYGNHAEASKRRCPKWITVQANAPLAYRKHNAYYLVLLLFDEQDLEPEYLAVPVSACGDVAHGDPDMMDSAETREIGGRGGSGLVWRAESNSRWVDVRVHGG